MSTATASTMNLSRNENQALGIGTYACNFMRGDLGDPSDAVKQRTIQFFTDSILCGLSALALQTNAPCVLRAEALDYPAQGGASVLGSTTSVAPEKAIAANASAVQTPTAPAPMTITFSKPLSFISRSPL